MHFAELDAVTLDAFGTLVELVDPVPALEELLQRHGLERGTEEIGAAFEAEGAHYRRRSVTGRDEASLAALHEECAGVFLRTLGASAVGDGFAAEYVQALRFEIIPGVHETLDDLRGRGLALAVVSNWDVSLHVHLADLGLSPFFDTVVTSAEAGVEKPRVEIFELALARLGVSAHRALHVGDQPSDEQGARVAAMRFARAPLAEAFTGWR
jgi:putative hydrolase of the HAD superfamily